MNPASNQSHGYGCLTKEDLGKLSLSKVPIPINEAWRIFTLRQTELLDSDASDPSFDRFATLASRMFSVPIALVSLVDIDRQWFKANVGLEHVSQTHRDLAFCSCTYHVLMFCRTKSHSLKIHLNFILRCRHRLAR